MDVFSFTSTGIHCLRRHGVRLLELLMRNTDETEGSAQQQEGSLSQSLGAFPQLEQGEDLIKSPPAYALINQMLWKYR